MRVHHLDGGRARPAGGWLTARLPAASGRAGLVCHLLLVESDAGLVLVDTGAGEGAVTAVRSLGFEADDVRHVILTSLEGDHAGGVGHFENAQVHVLATAYAAAAPRAARWRLHAPVGERWFGLPCVRAPTGDDDILLVPLPGPAPGHAGVAVRDEHGWLLHAGDAYLWREEVHGWAPPPCPARLALARRLLDDDHPARAATIERLRILARDPDAGVLVFSSHDPLELDLCAERNSPAVAAGPTPAEQSSPAGGTRPKSAEDSAPPTAARLLPRDDTAPGERRPVLRLVHAT